MHIIFYTLFNTVLTYKCQITILTLLSSLQNDSERYKRRDLSVRYTGGMNPLNICHKFHNRKSHSMNDLTRESGYRFKWENLSSEKTNE